MANLILIGTASYNSDTELSFNIDTVSNFLVAVFVASSASQDTTEPSALITDSLGNGWNLTQWIPEAGDQPALALYTLPPVPSIATGIATLDMPVQMIPGDSVSTAILGWLYASKLANISADSYTVNIMTNYMSPPMFTGGSAIVTQSGSDDLIVGLIWSSLNGATVAVLPDFGPDPGDAFYDTLNIGESTSDFVLFGGWNESTTKSPVDFSGGFYTASSQPQFSYIFAVSLSLSGQINGGSGNSTRAFFLSRAPEPKISIPSRFIATIQIDCTQMIFNPFTTSPCQFPEFTFPIGGVGEQLTYGWSVLEFDLEHIGNSGGGLDQVRKLIAHSRPTFGYSADNQPGGLPQDGAIGGSGATYALLTNTTTLQTEVLGGGAIQAAAQCADPNEAGYCYEKLHCSFPGHKGGMKYRFLALSNSAQGAGLYTLNFLNYDDGQGSLQYTGLLYGTSD